MELLPLLLKSILAVPYFQVGTLITATPAVLSMWARVNQQPPMHQLAVLSTGWAAVPFDFRWGSSQSISFGFFLLLIAVFSFWGFVFGWFFLGFDLTHSYPTHLPTLISIVPTLVLY
jgi:hypothetical protein